MAAKRNITDGKLADGMLRYYAEPRPFLLKKRIFSAITSIFKRNVQ